LGKEHQDKIGGMPVIGTRLPKENKLRFPFTIEGHSPCPSPHYDDGADDGGYSSKNQIHVLRHIDATSDAGQVSLSIELAAPG